MNNEKLGNSKAFLFREMYKVAKLDISQKIYSKMQKKRGKELEELHGSFRMKYMVGKRVES